MFSRGTRIAIVTVTVGPAVAASAIACSDAKTGPVATAADGSADAAGDASPDGSLADGGCAPHGSFGSAKCNACIDEKCCAELGTCSADATCTSRMTCELACLNERADAGGCAAECERRFPDDAGKYQPLLDCVYGTNTCAFYCAVEL